MRHDENRTERPHAHKPSMWHPAFTLTILIACFGSSVVADRTNPENPRSFVERFMREETEGARLTDDGYRQASTYFVHPSPFSKNPTVFVIGNEFLVWDPMKNTEGNRARINVEIDPKGHIDGQLRFTPAGKNFLKSFILFNLLYVPESANDAQPSDNPAEKVPRSGHWLIADPNDTVVLTAKTATRYVTEMRDKSTDPIVKKNADATLAQLAKLH